MNGKDAEDWTTTDVAGALSGTKACSLTVSRLLRLQDGGQRPTTTTRTPPNSATVARAVSASTLRSTGTEESVQKVSFRCFLRETWDLTPKALVFLTGDP